MTGHAVGQPIPATAAFQFQAALPGTRAAINFADTTLAKCGRSRLRPAEACGMALPDRQTGGVWRYPLPGLAVAGAIGRKSPCAAPTPRGKARSLATAIANEAPTEVGFLG